LNRADRFDRLIFSRQLAAPTDLTRPALATTADAIPAAATI